jgi:protein involved in ribonucleotide reduction
MVTAPIWYTRSDITLPITLTSLRARYNGDNNQVAITWTTSQENNSKEFVVERSSNGVNFTAIGSVAAAGNSNRSLNYSFTDQHPLSGNNFYRLRQVDLDGKAQNSPVVKVVISQGLYVSFGPNPARQFVTINIQNNRGPVAIQLTDLNGRVMQQRSLPATAAQTIQLPVSQLPQGIYLLKVTSTEGIMTEKIMVE